MEQPVQLMGPQLGDGDHLGNPRTDAEMAATGPVLGTSLLTQWHAFKGRPIDTELDMEFHRQLDHVAVWIDWWSHQQVSVRAVHTTPNKHDYLDRDLSILSSRQMDESRRQ